MNNNLLPWTEKYRPDNLSSIIGHTDLVNTLKAFVKQKNMPNLLLAGPPGCGKTTATIALSKEIFGENYKSCLLELNASDTRGIDVVRGQIKDFAKQIALTGAPFKIIFLDEADALTPDAQHALRRTMEVYAGITRFILSCNYSSKILEPIQSRCSVFRFTKLLDRDIEEMINNICKNEGLSIDKKALDALIYISEGDMRKAINALQGVALQSNKITDELIYKLSSRAKPKEIRDMIDFCLKANFIESRKKLDAVMIEYGMSGEDVLLQIYKEVPNLDISEENKIRLVDKIGEFNFRIVEGANERIQLEALLAQIMLIGKSKD
ncbi:replication factor C small subunit [Candidatus Micrarchaeota archaeon]|nr:replication factor C small subunit [Candidatus Micrarchaeota archaeon]